MPLPTLVRALAAAPRIALLRLLGRLTLRPVALVSLDSGTTTLIADAGNHRVIEVDGTGAIVWQYGTTGTPGVAGGQLTLPRDAKRLADGRTLIADSGNNRVIEVARDGSIVWTFEDLALPRSAARLPNGNTLIADYGNHRVVEINAIGAMQWSYGTRGVAGSGPNHLRRPRHAERTAGGNTLIADEFSRVIEVTAAGAIVWQRDAPVLIHSATRLETGNTLMAVEGSFLSFGTLEFTPTHDLAWYYMSLETADAKRLPSGNTLVSLPSRSQVIELDTERNIVWQYGTENTPGAGANQLRDPWEATRITAASPGRPDLSLRAANAALEFPGPTGAGVFGDDGMNQSLGPDEVWPGRQEGFVFQLSNAGSGEASFRVTATPSEIPGLSGPYDTGWAITFRDAADDDITAAVLGSGWITPAVAAGARLAFRADVKNKGRGSGEQLWMVVKAQSLSDPPATDAVRAGLRATHFL